MAKNPALTRLLGDLKKFYRAHGRSHLPWRQTRDPYKILVSEVMLQQTQVDRVVPFYNAFIKKFPTPQKLATATLSEVLRSWQGLGYNRRAKYLHETAKILSGTKLSRKKSGLADATGELRRTRKSEDFWRDSFVKLPGVGCYTRGAVMAFALNRPEVFVETNIRTVIIHYCFSNATIYRSIPDQKILPLVAEALQRSKMEPREFYAAMMDYGAHLKKQGIKLNARSKHYAKQSRFEGSARQKRAALLRTLLAKGASEKELLKTLHS